MLNSLFFSKTLPILPNFAPLSAIKTAKIALKRLFIVQKQWVVGSGVRLIA
jgi:hypothetical protein